MKRSIRTLQRLVNAASPVGFTVIAVAFAALSFLNRGQASPSVQGAINTTILIAIALAIAFWMFQTRSEYIRRANDPTWILKFQDHWDAIGKQRKLAAAMLLKHQAHLSDARVYKADLDPVDDVLDVLEYIGFYVEGEQISPEVAHEHFYYWIKGYWYASQSYIAAVRERDPTRWEYLASLYDETSRIEARRAHKPFPLTPLNQDDVASFLEEEISVDKADSSG